MESLHISMKYYVMNVSMHISMKYDVINVSMQCANNFYLKIPNLSSLLAFHFRGKQISHKDL